MPPSPPPTASTIQSNALHRLPPSPSSSHSSLTSEDVSFDHLAPPGPSSPSTSTPATLGLIDLVNMRGRDKAARRAAGDDLDRDGGGAISVRVRAAADEGDQFARQVVIRGWKVVGGKSWTDGGKVGAYVVYDIDIGLRNGGNINILRRYTDFVRLRSMLKERYPHLRQAIPPLPGKAHMSKFSPKFLGDRQPRLQRFLKGVILHPEMGRGGTGSVVGAWVIGEDLPRPGGEVHTTV
ncbi:hypothetical protein IAT38_007655 [Cryptococcus sp. DSM 104549]